MKIELAYKKAFEQNCIELIIHAYTIAIAEKKFNTNWLENDFSELLGYYVNDSQLSLDKGITCKTEKKLLSETNNQTRGFADKLPRIDFVYFKIWRQQRFHCYMEAKRLKEKDSDLKRAYIDQGMERYISEKYPLGCMLGYLVEGGVNETINGINSLLKKDKRDTEVLNPIHQKFHNSYFESQHTSIGSIKHIIFDFTF